MDLTIILPTGERRFHTLNGERATVGRRADCDIAIDSKAVSRVHAELVRKKDGQWEIRDLGSLNGLEVRGKPVAKWTLQDGDEVTIGDARLYVGQGPHDDSTIILPRVRTSAGLWLDGDYRCLRYGETQVGKLLADLEYKLLKVLSDANGHVVERRRIEEAVWGQNAYDDNALHQLVRRTREKIGDDASTPRILLTLPGVGYRLDLTIDITLE
jgi:hypothetical protein